LHKCACVFVFHCHTSGCSCPRFPMETIRHLLQNKVWDTLKFHKFCSTRSSNWFIPCVCNRSDLFPDMCCLTFLKVAPLSFSKVTIRTGKTCKRSPSSVVLQSLFLNFTSKVANIFTLIFQVLLLWHRPLSWQQSISRMTDIFH